MRKSLFTLFLALLGFGLSVFLSCGDDDNDDASDDEDDDDDESNGDASENGETWTDPISGLMWQNGSEIGTWLPPWLKASEYCENLTWSGYNDWRLPSISELRGLIRGCENIAADGPCGVTDSCLDRNCWDEACTGCGWEDGPGPGGLYWPTSLTGECVWYWSSSPIPNTENLFWGIYFAHGYLSDGGPDYGGDSDSGGIRCVR